MFSGLLCEGLLSKSRHYSRICVRVTVLLSYAVLLIVVVELVAIKFGSGKLGDKKKRASPTWRHSYNDRVIPPVQNRRTEFRCRPEDHTFYATNLYFLNGQFVGFLGENQEPSQNCRGMTARLGIGFGSNPVRLYFVNKSTQTDEHWVAYNENVKPLAIDFDDPRSKTIWIRLYPEDPPHDLSIDAYHAEPLVVFSTLWPNFFRTIYAGVAAWYTLMSYRIFFPQAHQFLLVDPSPDTFQYLLEDVVPLPLLRWDREKKVIVANAAEESAVTSKANLWKAVVFGLSKEVQLDEIEVEKGWGWVYRTRSFAFRVFCSKIKVTVLSKARQSNRIQGWVNQVLPGHVSENTDPFREIYNQIWQSENLAFKTGNVDEIAEEKMLEEMKTSLKRVLMNNRERPQPAENLKVSFIVRDKRRTRRLLNEDAVIDAIRTEYPSWSVGVYNFDDYSFDEQLKIVDDTDVLMSIHGAAIAHVMFLRTDTYLVELFPYGFRKRIYQNLARSMGVHYFGWENSHPHDTEFHWKYVEENRFGDYPRHTIENTLVNWYNMDSKNYWRNQDTRVSLCEFKRLLNRLHKFENHQFSTRYFLYLPWEQLNNQLIGLKSACAVSKMLGRVLVIPDIGYRNSETTDRSMFNPVDYIWDPIHLYFNFTTIIHHLPCKFITMDEFVATNEGRNVGHIYYNELGPDVTSKRQMTDYWDYVLRIPRKYLKLSHTFYRHEKKQISELYREMGKERVLVVGSMFWHYNFGLPVEFPQKRYFDYMNSPYQAPFSHSKADGLNHYTADSIYRQITQAITPHWRLKTIARWMIQQMRKKVDFQNTQLVTIHLRRGDYQAKCTEDFLVQEDGWKTSAESMQLFSHCYATPEDFVETLKTRFRSFSVPPIIYISTNIAVYTKNEILGDEMKVIKCMPQFFDWNMDQVEKCKSQVPGTKDLRDILSLFPPNLANNVFLHNDIAPSLESKNLPPKVFAGSLNAVDRVILDMWIGVESERFVGNRWSSFSRHVTEWRQLRYEKHHQRTGKSLQFPVVEWL